jgi:hypothetical protein
MNYYYFFLHKKTKTIFSLSLSRSRFFYRYVRDENIVKTLAIVPVNLLIVICLKGGVSVQLSVVYNNFFIHSPPPRYINVISPTPLHWISPDRGQFIGSTPDLKRHCEELLKQPASFNNCLTAINSCAFKLIAFIRSTKVDKKNNRMIPLQ